MNTLPNNKEVTEEIRKEIKRFIETNDSENMKTQNLWDSAKAVLGGKFITIQSYIKKEEKHQIDNLTLHLKQLLKEQQQEQQQQIQSQQKERNHKDQSRNK